MPHSPPIVSTTIKWQKYPTFFELYDAQKTQPVLIYVIGDTHHCYIGCVGCKKGTQGLAMRYAKQYVDRSVAIFGLDPNQGQVAYAGLIETPPEPLPAFVELLEKNIQTSFISCHGQPNALFLIKGQVQHLAITHTGSVPAFLKNAL
jgi:hypothetical protein